MHFSNSRIQINIKWNFVHAWPIQEYYYPFACHGHLCFEGPFSKIIRFLVCLLYQYNRFYVYMSVCRAKRGKRVIINQMSLWPFNTWVVWNHALETIHKPRGHLGDGGGRGLPEPRLSTLLDEHSVIKCPV